MGVEQKKIGFINFRMQAIKNNIYFVEYGLHICLQSRVHLLDSFICMVLLSR